MKNGEITVEEMVEKFRKEISSHNPENTQKWKNCWNGRSQNDELVYMEIFSDGTANCQTGKDFEIHIGQWLIAAGIEFRNRGARASWTEREHVKLLRISQKS